MKRVCHCDRPCSAVTENPGQLPPVGGRALHAGQPKNQLSQEGFSSYGLFRLVIILQKVHRQRSAGKWRQCPEGFPEVSTPRDGIITEDDWRLLLTRAPHQQADGERESFKNATHLFYSKAEVKYFNGTKLRELGTSVLKVEAKHSSSAARRATADLAQGLQRYISLARCAKVTLTRNSWSEMGLVNGIRREVLDIVWAKGQEAPALPDFVVLRLEGYTGPVSSSDPRYQGCVPVPLFETSWSTTGNESSQDSRRRQLPLALCWPITMHKSQGC